MKTQTQLHQSSFRSNDGFIEKYRRLIRNTVIPYQYSVLSDKAEGAEKSHVIDNFRNAANALHGGDIGDGFYGMVFQDSDAAKWLEAVAYSLAAEKNDDLEKTADALIDLIEAAQDKDGYLDTYFTIKDRDKRWTNLLEGHELYCAGHMMEAACAYYEATGKDKLLRVMERNAQCIYDHFMREGTLEYSAFPGHPEVELALMKMYRTTGSKKYLELARHFVDVRGEDPHFYEKEKEKRDWTVWGNNPSDTNYSQAFAPVRRQDTAVGHAVRAVYLYTAMADLAGNDDDKELLSACEKLWDSITRRRMYVTGGIGSTVCGEAFTADYDLPSDTVYAETCASIGLIFFASRMLENDVDSRYSDVMERAFYNTVLGGMQLDGKRFFYVNPLEVVPGIAHKTATHWHVLPERPKWYACACCPPNVARLISSFEKYAFGESSTTGYIHLYANGTVSFKNGATVTCETEYPYGLTIKLSVSGSGEIAVRLPKWSRKHDLSLNGGECPCEIKKGYAYISAQDGDVITLELSDEPYYVYPSAKVPDLSGQAAVCRGPLVYCFEGVDNDGDVLSLSIDTDKNPTVSEFNETLGAVTLKVPALRAEDSDELYSSEKPVLTPCETVAVPYYTWGNRGENQMKVWLAEK